LLVAKIILDKREKKRGNREKVGYACRRRGIVAMITLSKPSRGLANPSGPRMICGTPVEISSSMCAHDTPASYSWLFSLARSTSLITYKLVS